MSSNNEAPWKSYTLVDHGITVKNKIREYEGASTSSPGGTLPIMPAGLGARPRTSPRPATSPSGGQSNHGQTSPTSNQWAMLAGGALAAAVTVIGKKRRNSGVPVDLQGLPGGGGGRPVAEGLPMLEARRQGAVRASSGQSAQGSASGIPTADDGEEVATPVKQPSMVTPVTSPDAMGRTVNIPSSSGSQRETLQRLRSQLRSRDEMMIEMQARMAEQEDIIDRHVADVERLEEEVGNARRQLAESNAGREAADSMRVELASVRMELQNVLAEAEGLKADLEGIRAEQSSLVSENRELQARLRQVEKGKADAESAVDSAVSSQGHSSSLYQEATSVPMSESGVVNGTTPTRLGRSNKLRELQEELRAMEEERAGRDAQDTKAKEKILVLEKDLKALLQENLSKEKKMERWQKEKGQMTEAMKDLEMRVEEQERQLEILSSRRDPFLPGAGETFRSPAGSTTKAGPPGGHNRKGEDVKSRSAQSAAGRVRVRTPVAASTSSPAKWRPAGPSAAPAFAAKTGDSHKTSSKKAPPAVTSNGVGGRGASSFASLGDQAEDKIFSKSAVNANMTNANGLRAVPDKTVVNHGNGDEVKDGDGDLDVPNVESVERTGDDARVAKKRSPTDGVAPKGHSKEGEDSNDAAIKALQEEVDFLASSFQSRCKSLTDKRLETKFLVTELQKRDDLISNLELKFEEEAEASIVNENGYNTGSINWHNGLGTDETLAGSFTPKSRVAELEKVEEELRALQKHEARISDLKRRLLLLTGSAAQSSPEDSPAGGASHSGMGPELARKLAAQEEQTRAFSSEVRRLSISLQLSSPYVPQSKKEELRRLLAEPSPLSSFNHTSDALYSRGMGELCTTATNTQDELASLAADLPGLQSPDEFLSAHSLRTEEVPFVFSSPPAESAQTPKSALRWQGNGSTSAQPGTDHENPAPGNSDKEESTALVLRKGGEAEIASKNSNSTQSVADSQVPAHEGPSAQLPSTIPSNDRQLGSHARPDLSTWNPSSENLREPHEDSAREGSSEIIQGSQLAGLQSAPEQQSKKLEDRGVEGEHGNGHLEIDTGEMEGTKDGDKCAVATHGNLEDDLGLDEMLEMVMADMHKACLTQGTPKRVRR